MEHAGPEAFKARRLQLFSRLKLKTIFPGEWSSIYTGGGIEFATSRPYEPGDDLRDLDLQMLVQSGEEEIIEREATRQRKIYLWVDVSGSMKRRNEMFFAHKTEVRDIAVGLLAFSGWGVYSPVGLCTFDRDLRQFFPARFGESYCEEIVGWFMDHADDGPGWQANVPRALEYLDHMAPSQSLVFFISDFQDGVFEAGVSSLFRAPARKFDFVPILIQDPLEVAAPLKHPVTIALRDDESAHRAALDLRPATLAQIQTVSAHHAEHLSQGFAEIGLELVRLSSPDIDDCFRILSSFFLARRRTRG